ncbi:Processing alpha glucosidase I [Vermiconidia calcicola]|uniref:Processing alpha glucosidase I n=1 Tax=Vermiconidia calcicola TaxID=1690605 RepID=A0ACC3MFV7_9PEZI|nr:Processing alpha glucosidase I [Vermiconidia calcicola]
MHIFYYVVALCSWSVLGKTLTASEETLSINSSRGRPILWGPYRPNVYFGMRARTPDSPLIGLMWAPLHDGDIVDSDLRHTCEQADHMRGYGWTEYDVRHGGMQTLHDAENGLDMETSLVMPERDEQRGSWAARIKVSPAAGTDKAINSTIILYIGLGTPHLTPPSALNCEVSSGIVRCVGSTPRIGDFQLSMSRVGVGSSVDVWGSSVSDDNVWQAKATFLDNRRAKTDDGPPNKNIYFLEATSEGESEFDIVFSSGSVQNTLNSIDLDREMRLARSSFSSRFDALYRPQSPFSDTAFAGCSKALLSNLLGGLGYFYGDSRVDAPRSLDNGGTTTGFWKAAKGTKVLHKSHVLSSSPSELFSFVPSRPFFPRGFLWDEGFHLLLVLKWDLDLAIEVLVSWIDLIDENGWIAREQILGAEARSKVPPEFQIQHSQHANPPTLFLAVGAICEILSANGRSYHGHDSKYLKDPETGIDFIRKIYPLMERQYTWFRRTQAGNMNYTRPYSPREGYRWRGRTPGNTFASGLDDYPRAEPPHPGELHVDALSWVGAMADSLGRVAAFLDDGSASVGFAKERKEIVSTIDALHWSAKANTFCDASVDDDNNHVFTCHKGCVSLFPFMLGLMVVNDSRLDTILSLLQDPNHLWSPHGIRSLSRMDPYYGTDEDYWRSPIWVNINYLLVKQLLILVSTPGPYSGRARHLYNDLRRNIVTTVYDSWQETGFAWEQYNAETGAGQRTQHFTGWTALVVDMMAMPDLERNETIFRVATSDQFMPPHHLWLAIAILILIFTFRKRLPRLIRR